MYAKKREVVVLSDGADVSTKLLFAIQKAGTMFLDLLYPPQDKYRHRRYYLRNKLQVLKDKGLVKISTCDGRVVPELTPVGERCLAMYLLTRPNKPKRWDGKWRIIIFDIWEKRRRMRDLLREEIRTYGFVKVQNSVWAYPYDCEEFVALLKTDLNVGRGLLFLLVERIEDDHILRSRFGL
ncbi:MAG TPA: hypothetical protein VJG48_01130 [Candidatus Paceibacterota bacterium]